eukprot:615092-Prymnesium_polylepis.2
MFVPGSTNVSQHRAASANYGVPTNQGPLGLLVSRSRVTDPQKHCYAAIRALGLDCFAVYVRMSAPARCVRSSFGCTKTTAHAPSRREHTP